MWTFTDTEQERAGEKQLHPIEQSVKSERHNSSEIETQPTLIPFFTLSWFFPLSLSLSLSLSFFLTFCRPWPMMPRMDWKYFLLLLLQFSKLNLALLVTHNCTQLYLRAFRTLSHRQVSLQIKLITLHYAPLSLFFSFLSSSSSRPA